MRKKWYSTQTSEYKERVNGAGLLWSKPLPMTKACVSSYEVTNLMKKNISVLEGKKYIQDSMTKLYKEVSNITLY